MLELAEKRTLHSKTHDLGNGQHRLTASMIPMHYEDNGQLLDIDMNIQNGVVNSGLYKVELMTDKIGFHAIDRGSGKKISVSLGKIGNDSIAYSTPTIDAHKAIWPSVKPGVDIEFWFNPHQVNIFRVLKTAQAEKQVEWEVEEELGEKTIKMNDKIRGRDASKNETKHTVVIAPPSTANNRKSYVIRDTFDDRVYKRNPQTRVKEESTDVSYPVRIDPTITLTIDDTTDDGFAFKHYTTATHYPGTNLVSSQFLNNIDAVIVSARKTSIGTPTYQYNRFRKRRSYLRFHGITIPQSSTINSASLKPFVLGNMSANFVAKIKGKKTNNPVAPTNVAQVLSAGTLASNEVQHTFVTTNTATTNTNYANVNIQTIVQELVNSFDYSNESMLFFIDKKDFVISPTATNTPTAQNIRFYDFSNGTPHPAQLVIDYTAAGGGSAIKTWNGLADASTKTSNGLARASVKTRNGLA